MICDEVYITTKINDYINIWIFFDTYKAQTDRLNMNEVSRTVVCIQ